MIVILFTVAGAIWGGRVAKKRGGNGLDIAQYAAGYGIAFGLLGLFLTVAISWMLAV
jgi:hypothetical protein